MRILVTDSDTRPALAVVRALGREGYEVVVAGVSHPSLAGVSRYARRCETYPDPQVNSAQFIAAIVEIVERLQIDVLMPITEITTLLTTQHRSSLPPTCHLPFPDAATVANSSNKVYVLALAEKLGVPIPLSVVVTSADEGIGQAGTLTYPVVVKPGRSRVLIGTQWQSTSVTYADSPQELEEILQSIHPELYPVLLQERIEGPGTAVFACFAAGEPVAFFAHRRLREKPPSGGVSVLCESSPLDPTAKEYATKLLTNLQWNGVAMVEFKQDSRDGSLRLMEINARFWGSLQLAITAGVNFPVLLARLAMGDRAFPEPQDYRIKVRSRWLAGDLDNLALTLTRSRRRLNLAPMHPGRVMTLLRFLRLWGRNLSYEVEQRDDLAPARLEWTRRFRGS